MRRLLGAVGLSIVTAAVACPAAHAGSGTLERADSLYALGERAAARQLYAAAFGEDADQTRALFRLAELTDNHAEAVKLYEQYARREPTDAWGPMAAGDRLARMGHIDRALARYDRAAQLAPGERDVTLGRTRILERAGRCEAADALLTRWLADHPDDAELGQAQGRIALRAGRPRQARRAFERLLKHATPTSRPAAVRGLEQARAQSALTVQPLLISSRDSDGNRLWATGASADVLAIDGARLGVRALRRDITGPSSHASTDDAGLELTLRPRSNVRIGASAFAVRMTLEGLTTTTTQRAGDVRVRWGTAGTGANVDLRAQRVPSTATTELIANKVMRNEFQIAAELPLAVFRLRAAGRVARLESSFDHNLRSGGELRLALPVGSLLMPWARYEAGRHRDATTAGYFAPRRAEGVSLGSSFTAGDGTPWTMELEAGVGFQRYASHGGVEGEWRPGAEGYLYSSAALGRGRELRLEVESSDSPGLSPAAATSANWSYWSATVSLRWAL